MSDAGQPARRGTRRERLLGLDARNRQAVTDIGERYSLFARLMRFALPGIAAVLLALVVVWPLISGKEEGFRLGFAPADPLDSGPLTMDNARYMGIDASNQAYTIIAERAVQESAEAELVELTRPKADINLSDDSWLALTAERGQYFRTAEVLELDGAVNAFSDRGFEMRTEHVHITLAEGRAESVLPVEGQGPLGVLNAIGFVLTDRGQRILFGGPVKLVIYPRAEGAAP